MFSRNIIASTAVTTLLTLLSGCGGGGGTSLATNDEAADPVVLDIPIAYIKRPAPEPESTDSTEVRFYNLDDPIEMFPGARLYIRPRSSNLADEIDLTDQIIDIVATELDADPDLLGIDIKGLEVSFDGSQLIFSVRAIPDFENNNEPELFTWNLWLYDFETNTVSYLIDSPLIRDEGADSGGGHDMDPHFLTDDRIVFSSSRQSAIQEKQLNEGRGQRYSPVAQDNNNVQTVSLHIYDPDTQEIQQISLTRTADMGPATLDSGEIIFSRRNNDGIYNLYQINPSGAQSSVLYGSASSDLVASEESIFGVAGDIHFLNPRELPDGRIMTLIQPGEQTTLGGDIALINTQGFIDLFTPTNTASSSDSRAQLALTDLEVNALDVLSPGGKFLAAYPLQDGSERVLVSWSPCRIQNEEGLIKPCSIAEDDDRVDVGGNLVFEPAPELFGLWMYSTQDQTQLPVVLAEEGFIISEVIAAEPRSYPDAPDESDIIDPTLAAENKGLIIIDSVYNQDEGLVNYAPLGIAAYSEPGTLAYTDRPGRFMRVLQPVPVPNRDVLNLAPGRGRYGLLEILGYVPVEPDGSVIVKVPANTPVMLNTVRADGRRISPRYNDHWIQVAPGEILRCVGCHDPNSDVPHGRLDSQPPSQNPGAISLASGQQGFRGADPALIASELGQTMAEVYNSWRPVSNLSEYVRDLQLQLTYTDEWTDTSGGAVPDPDIDLTYDPAWNIPEANAIISPNLDPELQGRIVINYNDHIQPIWDRERVIELDGNEVLGQDGTAATSCVSCHTTAGETRVPAGQLDLTGLEFNDVTRSYDELTTRNREYWITGVDMIGERQRLCTYTDADGNDFEQLEFPTVPAAVSTSSALNSRAFFNCFESGDPTQCGNFSPSALPANCTEDGGTPVTGSALTTKPIPDDFDDAEVLMAAKATPASLTDPMELMNLLQTNCTSCHDSDSGNGGAAFPHSETTASVDPNDILQANRQGYLALMPYINLVNPGASTFVFRLQTQNHQCWDNADGNEDCDAAAAEMLAAITSFADAIEPVEVTLPGGTPAEEASFDHTGLLTPSELRLLSEWLDIGGPYYNNPFDPRLFD